jgi:DNA polymerase-3 subunit epsilon
MPAVSSELWTPATPRCAFNAAFDLTMLDAELQRHLGQRLVLRGPVIDPQCIHRQLHPDGSGRPRLGELCDDYEVGHDGAHTSEGDALAAARLVWRLAKTEPERVGLVAPNVLHSRQVGWHHEQEQVYADMLEREAEGDQSIKGDRKRARAAAARASARSWPVKSPSGIEIPPARPGKPSKSHIRWPPELETMLRDEWLAANPTANAETLRTEIATRYKRTPIAIRTRLLQLMCDPELPGCSCDDERAAYLKQLYEVEYRRGRDVASGR